MPIGSVERLVEFCVREHNSVMPHAAFNGQTPDEVYFGTGNQVTARHVSSPTKHRLRGNALDNSIH